MIQLVLLNKHRSGETPPGAGTPADCAGDPSMKENATAGLEDSGIDRQHRLPITSRKRGVSL